MKWTGQSNTFVISLTTAQTVNDNLKNFKHLNCFINICIPVCYLNAEEYKTYLNITNLLYYVQLI